jgi:hypothetical protein
MDTPSHGVAATRQIVLQRNAGAELGVRPGRPPQYPCPAASPIVNASESEHSIVSRNCPSFCAVLQNRAVFVDAMLAVWLSITTWPIAADVKFAQKPFSRVLLAISSESIAQARRPVVLH